MELLPCCPQQHGKYRTAAASQNICPPEGIAAAPCELPVDADVRYCVDACENHVDVGMLQHAGRYIQGAGELPVLLGGPPQAVLVVPETSQRIRWGSTGVEASRHHPQVQGTGSSGTQHGYGYCSLRAGVVMTEAGQHLNSGLPM